MSPTPDQAGELLRANGLRSTPQRRAILGAFHGGRAEHLSADEVYAYASQSLPDLSRGTVYATLAEFAELGLLSAFGAPEPVRYETNTGRHSHLRCRVCLRVFDIAGGLQDPGQISERGFTIESVETRAEGVCAECNDYAAGLKAGAQAIFRSGPPVDSLATPGTAAAETDGPLGRLFLAATPRGVVRVAFEGHGDADALHAHAASRRGSQAARRHLAGATEKLRAYFDGAITRPTCDVDWAQLDPAGPSALKSTESIPYAGRRSYTALGLLLPARRLGRIMGANPIPLIAPCHRVTRGIEMPTVFVGGPERRRWLELHEREHSEARSG